jgi:hypothetical protein
MNFESSNESILHYTEKTVTENELLFMKHTVGPRMIRCHTLLENTDTFVVVYRLLAFAHLPSVSIFLLGASSKGRITNTATPPPEMTVINRVHNIAARC